VFYMLVRFYLEEEVENTPHPSARGSRKEFSYVRVSTDDKEEEEDKVKAGPQTAPPPPAVDRDTGLELELESPEDSRAAGPQSPPAAARKSGPPQSPSQSFVQGVHAFFTTAEVQSDREEDGDAIRGVVFCALGLNISFCVWGLLQERMLTQTYDGEYFVYSYGLVFMNRLGGLVLSLILMHYYRLPWTNTALVRTTGRVGGQGGRQGGRDGTGGEGRGFLFVLVRRCHLCSVCVCLCIYVRAVGVLVPVCGEHAVVLVPVRGAAVHLLPHGHGACLSVCLYVCMRR
jgi:hypothetical protein